MDNGELTVDNVLPLISVGLLLVPKLCLGILSTEALGNEAELQKKQFPSRSLGTRKNRGLTVPGVETPGYFRQSLRDAVARTSRPGGAIKNNPPF
ncbi:MAG: hypothetical protein D3922_07845 [Candidatus Electrothrix sp. AR1]|nr:hypothetical protein [Candidatus Electrothrix sp. AR1]